MYNLAKLQKCKKTCGLCEPLPLSPPSAPPSPLSPPEENFCSRLSNIKCSKKITIKKCEKNGKVKNKCKKYCNKDASKKKPKCEKTCCDLGFPF